MNDQEFKSKENKGRIEAIREAKDELNVLENNPDQYGFNTLRARIICFIHQMKEELHEKRRL